MTKLDKDGKFHRQENSSRRKTTVLSNSLLSKRDHTLTGLPCLVKTTGDTQSIETCLTGRNVPAVSASAYPDQEAHRTSKKKTPNIQ